MQTCLPARQPRYSPPARQVTAAYPGVGAMRTSRQRGIPVARVKGQLVEEALGAEHYAQRRSFIARALAGETVEFDQAMQWTGRDRQMHTLYLPHQENGVTLGLYALVTDVTAIRRNAADLTRLARFDALTGLPNRRHFDERLAEAMARTRRLRQPIALLFLDIDRLETINDSLGHAAGDAVLTEFARWLVNTVRGTDTMARLAGDEFVIILDAAGPQAEHVAGKIALAVCADFLIEGLTRMVTSSIGVGLFEGGAMTPGELAARADATPYSAKDAGRDVYRVAPAV